MVEGSLHDATARALVRRQESLGAGLARIGSIRDQLSRAAELVVTALGADRKVILAGNGGSAAQAQHFSAELVGRFRRERSPYPAISLTTDTSILTAIANDYSYDDVFARQVLGLGRPGDVLIAFSTTGESRNLLRAAEEAHERGLSVIAVTGEKENALSRLSDVALRAPGGDAAGIQELHMVITHVLCEVVEAELSGESSGR